MALVVLASLNNLPASVTTCSACTVTDCGGCSWPWQWFALGKADRPLFVTCNRCISVKNTLGRSVVVFFACVVVQLCPVVFCVVRAAYKFDFRLVIKETPKRWRPVFVKKLCQAVIEAHVCDRICMFSSRPSSRVLRDSTHAVKVNCILFS